MSQQHYSFPWQYRSITWHSDHTQYAVLHIGTGFERGHNYSQFKDPKCEEQHFESSSVPRPLSPTSIY